MNDLLDIFEGVRRYDDPHHSNHDEEMDIVDDSYDDCPFDDAVFDWSPDDAERDAPNEVE